jgi:aspartate/tyrosine/aromatic aminotransferase
VRWYPTGLLVRARRYLPIAGFQPFIDDTIKLAYGDNADVITNKQVAAVQALSGTGACRLMAAFQARFVRRPMVLIPKPTWPNHHSIWRDAGVQRTEFRYYNPETKGLDFEGMMEDLEVCSRTLLLSHPCLQSSCAACKPILCAAGSWRHHWGVTHGAALRKAPRQWALMIHRCDCR